jgi:hypothetical protein
MPCIPFLGRDGKLKGFICGPGVKAEDFSDDESQWYLCDYPIGGRETCDKKMCRYCAHWIDHDLHLCDEHFDVYRKNGNRLVSLVILDEEKTD